MTDEDKQGKKLTPTEQAIIDMMKKQNLQAQQYRQELESGDAADGDEKKHAFWDTQVRW